MFLKRSNESGAAAKATVICKVGQIGKTSYAADGTKTVALVTGTGDAALNIGMIYADPAKKVFQRGHFANASNSSMEIEQIAVNEVVTVLQGRIAGSTNQLNDGFYNGGDQLTVDFTTGRLKKAATGDVVYGFVESQFQGKKVTSQDNLIPVMLEFPLIGRTA